MKRTCFLAIGEVDRTTKQQFYQIMHQLGKRKENTLRFLMDSYMRQQARVQRYHKKPLNHYKPKLIDYE